MNERVPSEELLQRDPVAGKGCRSRREVHSGAAVPIEVGIAVWRVKLLSGMLQASNQSGTTVCASEEGCRLFLWRIKGRMKLLKRLKKDIRVVFERDPAARSVIEVVCCYQGLHAIWLHRLSHALYKSGWVLLPRLISSFCRFFTGIEIHPGATIGEGLFIDHGTGIVIGETAEIGKNVTLYQGVTLGGTGKEKGKRHPTIGNNVVIASGAKVLGSFTVGDHAKIGAGSVVLAPVPAYATVVGIPGRVVLMRGKPVREDDGPMDEKMRELEEEQDVDLAHDELPDPESEIIEKMRADIDRLENEVKILLKELEKKNDKENQGL